MRINDCQKVPFLGYSLNSPIVLPKKNKNKKIIARRLAFWQKQAGRITNIEKINL